MTGEQEDRRSPVKPGDDPFGELAVADWLIGELKSDIINRDARIAELTNLLHQQEAAFDADTKAAVAYIDALTAERDALSAERFLR